MHSHVWVLVDTVLFSSTPSVPRIFYMQEVFLWADTAEPEKQSSQVTDIVFRVPLYILRKRHNVQAAALICHR